MNASLFPATLSQEVRDTLRDWRKVSGPICDSNPCGPSWIVRVISTGKLYRIGDFTYQRMLKHGAEPTPYGWMELTEDGDPVETED